MKKEDDENAPLLNCNYVDFESFNYKNKSNEFSLFHLNIASLAKHKVELETSLNMLKYKFDIIGLTETKIIKGISPNCVWN